MKRGSTVAVVMTSVTLGLAGCSDAAPEDPGLAEPGPANLVHPDGSALHRIPLELPPGTGALNPSWSPDAAWIVLASSAPTRPRSTWSVPTVPASGR
jgi:hypothetical protein